MARSIFQAILTRRKLFHSIGLLVAIVFFPIYTLATHFPRFKTAMKRSLFTLNCDVDPVTTFASRFEAIRRSLPAEGTIRYQFHGSDGSPDNASPFHFQLTRYCLAPLVLSPSASSNYVLFDTENSIRVLQTNQDN